MDEYFSSKEFKEKLKMFETAHKHGSPVFMDCDDMSDIADYYHQLRRDPEALAVCDEALALYPHATTPLVMKARIHLYMDGNTDKAEQFLDEIEDKDDLEYYYMRAEIMLYKGKAKEAEVYLESIYDHMTDMDDREVFVIDVALLMLDYSQVDLAQQWLNLSDDVENPDYQEAKAKIAMMHGEHEKSEAIFNQLLDKNPYSTPYWNSLAASQLLHNDIHNAIKSSEYSIAINPNDEEALLNKADALQCLGNFDEALNYYKRYTEVGSRGIGLANQGRTYLTMGNPQTACDYFEQALASQDDSGLNTPEVIRLYCIALSDLKRIDEAVEKADLLFDLMPKEHYKVWLFKVFLYLSARRVNEAQRCCFKAITMEPNQTNVLLSISMTLHETGYYGYAYSLHRYLLDHAKEPVTEGYAFLADDCLQRNDMQGYLKYLEIACKVDPQEVEYVFDSRIPENVKPEDFWKKEAERINNIM